jgi:uncharacterized damage-inducible protein DinB
MTFLEALTLEYEQEMKSTRRLLECVPEDKFGWKPHGKSMTLGRLASHVAELAGRPVDVIRVDTLVRAPGNKPFVAASRNELLEKFDTGRAEAKKSIASLTEDRLDTSWTLQWGDVKMLEFPRALALRRVCMNHLIHHRAQLGVFLRLLDVPIPGMYGPSADDSPPR